ncbi:MAG: AIM24 family protein, partial [Clostridia bacterium]|nr:AIM24 family protein [Clostridia bacterium]
GSIKAYEVGPGKELIVQKSGFLAAESSVNLSVHFQKKLGSGIFGGEGFIMQKISGSGTVFVEIDGSAIEYELAAGETIIIDTGHLAVMDASCTMDIQSVPGLKNKLLGGEGHFNTVVTGPGKVLLQTMPVSAVAGEISKYIPSKG